MHETEAVPDPVMLPGLIDPQVKPEGIVSVRDTVPENPLSAVTAIVDGADWPALTGAGDEAEMVKSGDGGGCCTETIVVVWWLRGPLVPVTVTV